MRGVQPYDPVNHSLVIPHTTGTDDASYWEHFKWEKAIAAGMDSVGAPFSGKVEFIMTEMTWPLNHMVAPKENALTCHDCHTQGGRLKACRVCTFRHEPDCMDKKLQHLYAIAKLISCISQQTDRDITQTSY